MESTDDQPIQAALCGYNTLARHEATFPHYHYCNLPLEHEGGHRCAACGMTFRPPPPG